MPRHAKTKPSRRIWFKLLQFTSGAAVLLGLFAGVFFAWAYWGVGMDVGTVTRDLETATTTRIETADWDKTATLRHDKPPVEATPAEGELFAYIHVPHLGKTWKRAIQQGVSDRILASLGAGHYPQTAMPGQAGNSAYAGHDTPGDFGAFYDLPAGSEVIIESAANWYAYKLTNHLITTAQDTSVLDADAAGSDRGITLTTCWPQYVAEDTGQRFVWHGVFIGWAPKTDGVPASLAQKHVTVSERVNRGLDRVSEQVGMPLSGVLAACFAAMWLIADGIMWLVNRRRAAARWKDGSWNPLVWVWRLQAGAGGNKWVSGALRIFTLLFLCAAVVFASWRWACPWLSDTVPWLPHVPHPEFH